MRRGVITGAAAAGTAGALLLASAPAETALAGLGFAVLCGAVAAGLFALLVRLAGPRHAHAPRQGQD
ncbi:MAG: hypothetical protein D6811_09415 [Alphaproteobacteria bacterium]|nr:MAG: hypothetical protein D6811_09415 [Alphaproteobacteria bacterium]